MPLDLFTRKPPFGAVFLTLSPRVNDLASLWREVKIASLSTFTAAEQENVFALRAQKGPTLVTVAVPTSPIPGFVPTVKTPVLSLTCVRESESFRRFPQKYVRAV